MTEPKHQGATMSRRPLTRLAAAALTLGLSTGVVACSSSTEEISVSSGPTASAAPATGEAVDASTFAAALKLPGTTILDVRTPAEFAEGHLPGAINMDIENGTSFAQQVATLDPNGSYAIYCRSGNRSAVAVEYLTGQGFTSLYHLDGGIQAWEGAGGEVVTG
jgi:phage shock protein E